MNVEQILEGLTPVEISVLKNVETGMELREVMKKAGVQEVEAMRALQWLGNKGVLSLDSEERPVAYPDLNGEAYMKKGMPEWRLLKAVDRPLTLEDARKKAGIETEELGISIGVLKKQYAVSVLGERIEPTKEREKLLKVGSLAEGFLKTLPRELTSIKGDDLALYNSLSKRKRIIKTRREKLKFVKMTNLGRELSEKLKTEKLTFEMIERLTPRMLKDGSWRGKRFRRYDVEINVPRTYPGRRHFVNQAIEHARRIWVELGFREMNGPVLSTGFWNFDSLFTAQDHPVRDMQDTFYVESQGKLPEDKALVDRVKQTHENGWKTGSLGWRYAWSGEEAKRVCMRTHTTVLSARTLSMLKKADWPAKFFAVGKCFRNETLDWSHLFEFNQTEGIVVDSDANFRHLLGYLKEFYTKMGHDKIRFRPAYFPYTEMSVEIEAFNRERKQWMELGGAGIFRPEVVIPLLGEDVPVLAWGPGFDRTMLEYHNIKDIRELYRNDIKFLRGARIWL